MKGNQMESILRLLTNVKETQHGFVASCPVPNHGKGNGDRHPSLQIRRSEHGKILMKCHAGCKTREILDVLGLTMHDLFRGSTNGWQVDGDFSKEPLSREFRHKAYQAVLDQLSLSPSHRENLINRGLSENAIESGQFRSIGSLDRSRVAEAVFESMGEELREIPGFEQTPSGWRLYGSADGIVIPVLDLNGRIQAIKIRSQCRIRYSYLTGPGKNSCGSPVHIPAGTPRKCEVVRLTEGELKASIAFDQSHLPTIGIPGVCQWKRALPIIESLEARSVQIAYDSDFRTNQSVKNPLFQAVQHLRARNFQVSLETW